MYHQYLLNYMVDSISESLNTDRHGQTLAPRDHVLALHPVTNRIAPATIFQLQRGTHAMITFQDNVPGNVPISQVTKYTPSTAPKTYWQTWRNNDIGKINGNHHVIHNEVAVHIAEMEQQHEEAKTKAINARRRYQGRYDVNLFHEFLDSTHKYNIARQQLLNAKLTQYKLDKLQNRWEQGIKNAPQGSVNNDLGYYEKMNTLKDKMFSRHHEFAKYDRYHDLVNQKNGLANIKRLDELTRSDNELLQNLDEVKSHQKYLKNLQVAYNHSRRPAFGTDVLDAENEKYNQLHRKLKSTVESKRRKMDTNLKSLHQSLRSRELLLGQDI